MAFSHGDVDWHAVCDCGTTYFLEAMKFYEMAPNQYLEADFYEIGLNQYLETDFFVKS